MEIRAIAQQVKKKSAVSVSSAFLEDGSIAEMVYDPKKRETSFAVFKDGEWRYEGEVLVGENRKLIPYSSRNNLLRNRVALFPSKAEDYGSEEELLEEIRSFVHRYVDLSPLFERIACYYVLFSWIYDGFEELPYLRVLGDTGSGKTRFLLTVGSLCYKPIFASGASTVSPLFRILDIFRGTLVIDEGDFRLSDERVELIKILNNGHATGFSVLRTESQGGREYNPRSYQVFGPKIIATRGFFQDKALESRCLTEEMGERKLREDVPINLTREHREEALGIRNKLLAFRFRNLGQKRLDPGLVDRSIEPRLNQVFVPLLSTIQDERMRQDLRKVAREYHRQIISDRGMETEAQVLEVIGELLQSEQELGLKQITDRFAERYGEYYERKITPKWVGTIIRRKLKLKPEKRRDGYVIPPSEGEKLERLFEKYGVESPPEDNPVNVER